MRPEWTRSVAGDLQEKYRFDRVHGTYEVLAYQETTSAEVRTCTDPSVRVRAVPRVERNLARHVDTSFPLRLEGLPPVWQLAISACIHEAHLELAIICRCEFLDDDPHEQIEPREAEVVQEVMFDTPPAASTG